MPGTMQVTLRDPRRSEDGLSILAANSTVTVSREYGAYLVSLGAIDVGGVLASPPDRLTPQQVSAAQAIQRNAAATMYLAGDSLTANGLIVTGSNFINRASEGAFSWFDAFLGAPFKVVGSTAAGGKTCRQMIDEQFATIIAARPRYVWFTVGINDLYSELVTSATAAARIIEAVQKLLDAGITPIWSTVWHKAYDSVATPKHYQCNDILRQFAYSTECGLFWDGAAITADPTDTQGQGRTPLGTYYYDSTTHPNNLFAMRIGQFAAAALSGRIYTPNFAAVGQEDVTYSLGGSNLVTNPSFNASGAASGTGVTGAFPNSWKVDWPTRTGTGSAACAIVAINDPTTGLQIANGLQLTLSGAAAAGDVLRIYQSDAENAALRTSLSTGNVMQAEMSMSGATLANVSQIAMRVQANTNESTWWGTNQQTAGTYPATIPAFAMRTQPITVLGAGVAAQARHDLRLTFNGAGTGSVITVWRPRVRKVS